MGDYNTGLMAFYSIQYILNDCAIGFLFSTPILHHFSMGDYITVYALCPKYEVRCPIGVKILKTCIFMEECPNRALETWYVPERVLSLFIFAAR